MKRAEIARQYFNEGYACSQAVALAFIDLTDIDEAHLKKLALPFGGGLSRLRLTCGAISGMVMIVGLIFAKDENTHQNKMDTYAIVQELIKRFIAKRQTINCKELLEQAKLEVKIGGNPEERNNEYYAKRPCGKVVYDAADVLENYLIEKNIL